MSRGAFSDGGGRDRERNRLTRAINVTGERAGGAGKGMKYPSFSFGRSRDGRAEDLPPRL